MVEPEQNNENYTTTPSNDRGVRNVRVERRARPDISEDFRASQRDRTTQADLTRPGRDASRDTKSTRTTPTQRARRITQADITNAPARWDETGGKSKYDSVSDDYGHVQEARTTRSQLRSNQWKNTKPRALSKEERIRRINAAQKGHALRTTARSRATNQRMSAINAAGKEGPAKKLGAKFVLRGALFAAGYTTPLLLILFVLMLVGIFYAAVGLEEGVALITNGFGGLISGNIDAQTAFIQMAAGALVIVKEASGSLLELLELLAGFNLGAAIAFGSYALGAGIGVASAMITLLMFKAAPVGIHPLGGTRSSIKWMLFVSVLTLHALPFTFFAPWFLVWAWYVSRHPV